MLVHDSSASFCYLHPESVAVILVIDRLAGLRIEQPHYQDNRTRCEELPGLLARHIGELA